MTLSDAFLLSPDEPAPGMANAAHDPACPVGRGWLIALLFLCFGLRAGMAWRLQALSDDGFYYLSMADALGKGDYDTAFSFLSLNAYPAILAALHGLGLDWLVAGKAWGVFVGTLLVLPLYGLARRIFGERTALVACFLYAIHPNFIELAVEPVREATFWFAFTLCLWLTDRACQTRSIRWFALAGIASALAVHTRVEAWFLLVALAGWCFAMWRCDRAAFRPLAAGIVVWAAATPLFISAVNLTLLRGRDHWEWGRLHEVWLLRDAALKAIRPGPAAPRDPPAVGSETAATQENTDASRGGPRRIGVLPAAREYFRQFSHAVEPLYIVMLVVGLVLWRKAAFQSDVFPLVATAAVLATAIGVRLVFVNDINGRYFLTPLLCLLPFMAHGLRWLAAGGFALARRWRPTLPHGVAAAAVATGIALAGGIDALTASHVRRNQELALGRWLRDQLPAHSRITVDRAAMRLGYEIGGDLPAVLVAVTPDLLSREFADAAPDVLILTTRRVGFDAYASVVARAGELGMKPATLPDAPRTAGDFAILVRANPVARQALHTAGRPARQ